ncbi:MAG: type ISP restriction/modification enzyme [Aggregatilineales bacterium]
MPNLMPFISAFLSAVHIVHDSGKATDERSYYPALAALFNGVGAALSPRVVALHDVADRGVGHPDFLLQVETTKDVRAAVEVKGTAPELDLIIASEQVRRYLVQHDPIIVTNLREFALVRMGRGNALELIMRHTLETSEAAFWLASPTTLANEQVDRFGDFLIAAMTWDAAIKRPDDLADALARYAREALRRLASQPFEALAGLRKALSDSLGLQFVGAEGEHFFRSSLVQTLFYGLFSAWVACHQREECGDFRWREAGDYLGLPLIRELFEEIAKPSQLERFDIRKPLEWAEATLNRTVWDEFSKVFNESDAVNYFYEPFLEAFDPELRRDLGVWYTPREIVRYMVARADTVLREELGVEDGLADPNVYVLDPCCGTGAYLLETLRHIAATLKDKGEGALLAAELKKAATQRVFGFEILPAPFVVAQLQIGSLLTQFGAPLTGNNRASIYLTNSLTGWESTPIQKVLDGFPELKREAEAAAHVKQDAPILVILGNPPYSGFAGTDMKEEHDITNAYRTTVRAPRPQGQGLNDLYVRFFRMAERRIVEKTGKGIVCFISNYSWLDGLSHTGMRERYLEAFDQIYIDSLNGDKYRTGKLTPEGKPDPSVFSTATNPEGIQVGTAIATMVRREDHTGTDAIHVRQFWGRTKLIQLEQAASGAALTTDPYQLISPAVALGYPFVPRLLGADYLSWPKLTELFTVSFPGVKTSRDDVVVAIDRERLIKRMEQYFDPNVSHEQMRQIAPGAMENSARFQAEQVRDRLRKRGFLRENVVRYCYRPFDVRWLYWEPETKLLDEKRAEYFPHVFAGNEWLCATQQNRRDFDPPTVTVRLGSLHLIERGASLFPLYLKQNDLLSSEKKTNLSETARRYLDRITWGEPSYLFYHAIAIMHAPAYRAENAGALRQDWPRIPLPATKDALEASAALGRQIAALLDTETPIPGVTSGSIRDELKTIAILERVGGGQLNPDLDFKLQARWGYAGRGGITMPGQGTIVQRDFSPSEFPSPLGAGLGVRAVDVYLNTTAYWRNIPLPVWEYTIGGYQVIKKWLSYREYALLGRALTLEEVREVQHIARRIAAILLMAPALDTNYAAVKTATVKL